ncbi:MAG: hypothetical protein WDN06_10590 [Asticcacaulis sp.]
MSVLKTFAAICNAFARTSGWLIGAAIGGGALSVTGGMLLTGMVRTAGDDGEAILATLLPTMIAHAMFVVVISQITAASIRAVRFGKRQAGGVALITLLIAIVCAVAGHLPQPLLFFAPLVMTAILAWTPLVPAVAVGPVKWSPGRFATAVLTSLPFLALAEVFGFVPQAAAAFGMFEGGIIIWPLLGLYAFLLSATAAIVPTVVYATPPRLPTEIFA